MALTSLAYLPIYFALAILYAEYKAELKLPAPSFKSVGPSFVMTPVAQEEGMYASNDIVHKAQVLFNGTIQGSESVAIGKDGSLYMLDKFGTVWRSQNENTPEKVAALGAGRPLGFHMDRSENIVICNAPAGLQMLVKSTGELRLLASEAPSNGTGGELTPIRYANDLVIARDGSIYFTDSTEIPPAINAAGFYDTMASFLLATFQGDHTGRLLKYSPESKTVSFVADGFYYSNGVALAPDESFVLVSETCKLRVVRHWLKGPKAGQKDVFVEGLPGYPDGLTEGSEGTYWLSLVSLKNPALAAFMRYRVTRWLAPRLPASLKKAKSGTAIIQLSAEGKVLRYLDDNDSSHVGTISAVTEAKDRLYLGNLGGNFVSYLSKGDLPPILAH